MSSGNGLMVGAGPMSVQYAKVLDDLGVGFEIVGRGEASARAFEEATGHPVIPGGLRRWLESRDTIPAWAIVSVGVEELAAAAIALLERGVRHLLVEKPGALRREELEAVDREARARGARVIIAYNRRFYASVLHARRLIAEDGGVRSVAFEFTEWSHVIRGLPKAEGVKPAWFLGNSTHVSDLAFHLAGEPVELTAYISGALDWHPAAAVFAGAGRTDRGALFSYHADWDAPGRWVVEVMTTNLRLIFRPMEKLHVTRRGSVAVEEVEIDDEIDRRFKPGLHEQVRRFLAAEDEDACLVASQLARWDLYRRMAGYAA